MKHLLTLLLTIMSFSFTSISANTFPNYENVVPLENLSADEIYNLIKNSYSSLRLSDLSEVTANEEKKNILITGANTFNFSMMAVRIDGRIIMNIDFKIKDGRFKYIITVTDVYVENYGGMRQSTYNDLVNKPNKAICKKVFPHINKKIDELETLLNNIGSTSNSDENDESDW